MFRGGGSGLSNALSSRQYALRQLVQFHIIAMMDDNFLVSGRDEGVFVFGIV
jgi:hypothetical protein